MDQRSRETLTRQIAYLERKQYDIYNDYSHAPSLNKSVGPSPGSNGLLLYRGDDPIGEYPRVEPAEHSACVGDNSWQQQKSVPILATKCSALLLGARHDIPTPSIGQPPIQHCSYNCGTQSR
ncbi:hypothetical protein TRIATDRAFT_300999 [Trichoderma atroviride IMI 206040]|uniref:Uncharacterized protein n=1 Tax=Hypocrea atroviridis (strain ATCC 20476 / IMI 206040) TaxID=452589 RepID=G9P3R4_HYPAI|nr:uncharacterized protein TRIATDRAFT_300999 [Trichoderma atroviride IMI 206040]EHK43021.1 hypothetical protein TRIATDRAFT_300999 [Trichoderma atroviride IMI 206040]